MVSAPLKKLNNCNYCSEQPGLIYPEDKYAQKMEDGSFKCGKCFLEDLQKRKIRVLGINDPESQRIISEAQREVDAYNAMATRHNKLFNYNDLKLKKNPYLPSSSQSQ